MIPTAAFGPSPHSCGPRPQAQAQPQAQPQVRPQAQPQLDVGLEGLLKDQHGFACFAASALARFDVNKDGALQFQELKDCIGSICASLGVAAPSDKELLHRMDLAPVNGASFPAFLRQLLAVGGETVREPQCPDGHALKRVTAKKPMSFWQLVTGTRTYTECGTCGAECAPDMQRYFCASCSFHVCPECYMGTLLGCRPCGLRVAERPASSQATFRRLLAASKSDGGPEALRGMIDEAVAAGADAAQVAAAEHALLMRLAKGLVDLDLDLLQALVDSGHSTLCWVQRAQAASRAGDMEGARRFLRHVGMELEHDRRQVQAAFALFDKDNSDSLDVQELQFMLRYLCLPAEDRDIQQLMQVTCASADGSVTRRDFERWVLMSGGTAKLFRALASPGASGHVGEGMRAALHEAGISDTSYSFWNFTLRPSERDAVLALAPNQRHAVAHVRRLSEQQHQALLPSLTSRSEALGFSEQDLWATLSYIRERAEVIVHLQLDRPCGLRGVLANQLLTDTHYRNQFETASSGGSLNTSARMVWEHNLFGDAYDAATPFQRCKYGVLNVFGDPCGVRCCSFYGDSYIVLKDVRLRTTFAPTDSAMLRAESLACCDFYAHVLSQYSDEELKAALEVGTGRVASHDSDVIDNFAYKEAQIHGEIALGRHVEKLVVHPRHKQDGLAPLIAQACARHGITLEWMATEWPAPSRWQVLLSCPAFTVPDSMPLDPSAPVPLVPIEVEYFEDYDRRSDRTLKAAARAGAPSCAITCYGVKYVVDFVKMQQVNQETGKVRPVRSPEAAEQEARLGAFLAACPAAMACTPAAPAMAHALAVPAHMAPALPVSPPMVCGLAAPAMPRPHGLGAPLVACR